MFLCQLHVVPVSSQDYGHHSLAVDGKQRMTLLHKVQQIFIIGIVEVLFTQRTDIKVLQVCLRGQQALIALGFPRFESYHIFLYLFGHELHAVGYQIAGSLLFARHHIEALQHLGHGHGHIERTTHARPPRERTVGALQLAQTEEGFFLVAIGSL